MQVNVNLKSVKNQEIPITFFVKMNNTCTKIHTFAQLKCRNRRNRKN